MRHKVLLNCYIYTSQFGEKISVRAGEITVDSGTAPTAAIALLPAIDSRVSSPRHDSDRRFCPSAAIPLARTKQICSILNK